jgi:hypothetical protein
VADLSLPKLSLEDLLLEPLQKGLLFNKTETRHLPWKVSSESLPQCFIANGSLVKTFEKYYSILETMIEVFAQVSVHYSCLGEQRSCQQVFLGVLIYYQVERMIIRFNF